MPVLGNSYIISPSDDSMLAVEITRTGWRRRKKHILLFNRFSGEMCFAENDLAGFRLTLQIDSASVVCHDPWLSERKRRGVGEFARSKALVTDQYPEILFTAQSIRPKEVRGFAVAGELRIRDALRPAKASVVLGQARKDSVQIDGDITLRLSDFGVPRPSKLFGLIRTEDEILVRILLWAFPRSETVAL